MTHPISLVPWNQDFLAGLLDLALENTNGDLSRAEFIFPHSRPRRYLSLLVSRHPRIARPVIMPGMHTVSSLFSAASGRILARPAMNAGLLDRVGLLLACVRGILQEEHDGDMPFLDDARRFFPWGVRLAALFEECFSQNATPGNFLHMEEEVSPFAALLLSRLGRIFARYEAALREKEWTTPGLDAAVTAAWLENNPLPQGLLPPSADTAIFIAGFHALTGAEARLFHHLWEARGARVVIHADPALAGQAGPGKSAAPHWSCRRFTDWAKEWGTDISLVSHINAQSPSIRYVSGFDLHSQLLELEKELAEPGDDAQVMMPPAAKGFERVPPHLCRGEANDLPCSCRSKGCNTLEPHQGDDPPGPRDLVLRSSGVDAGTSSRVLTAEEEEAAGMDAMAALDSPLADHQADTLIALPDTGLLMPVLHHLPRVDVNISMGYPLARSPLFHLVDTLAKLQENRRGSGYYWRDLVALMRHPYLKMLECEAENEPAPASGRARNLQREMHELENALRIKGRKYTERQELPGLLEAAGPLSWEAGFAGKPSPLLQELLDVTLAGFEHLEKPVDLAEALERLCAFLLEYGRRLWKRFPIDAECLHRLRQSVIPELARSGLAHERFTPETLFTILRNLLDAERAPFEAVPLVGLQVMGMLETRLLTFRRVIVLDAVEESLPGSPPGDPLLPEALRPELGLPSLHGREEVAAYTFFRLVAGAREVLILWQEAADAPGIMDQKKKKSRFVEELLWQEEKRLGRLLAQSGRDGPLHVLQTGVTPMPHEYRSIAVTPPVRALMDDILARPISASLLDSYMRCPVRFYFERLVKLAPAEEVREGDDPAAVGTLLHNALKAAYQPLLGRRLPGGAALREMLAAPLLEALFSSPEYQELQRSLPADSRAMLAEAAKKRLGDYLSHQPPTEVLALEEELSASFCAGGRTWTLVGFADRMDLREYPQEPGEQAKEHEGAKKRTLSREHKDANGSQPAKDAACERRVLVLDYKTGRINRPSGALWEDAAFFQRLRSWRADTEEATPLLAELADRLGSVQLPLYLLLHSLEAERAGLGQASRGTKRPGSLPDWRSYPARDALWVALGEQGEEISLFPQKIPSSQRAELTENIIPELVYFLLRHMSESRTLFPCPGTHCLWCSAEKLCRIAAQPL